MKQSSIDPYCYPNTSVLRNLADIRDPHLLEVTEAALTASQAVLVEEMAGDTHDLERLLLIHRILFGKLYPFAGQFRVGTGRMTKVRASGSAIVYCDSAFIPQQLDLIFRSLENERSLEGLPVPAFARRAAYFYGELDAIHPFREGNSRTLRLFFSGLAKSSGLFLDWRLLAADAHLRGTLYAARDRAVMRGDSAPLAALFTSILQPL